MKVAAVEWNRCCDLVLSTKYPTKMSRILHQWPGRISFWGGKEGRKEGQRKRGRPMDTPFWVLCRRCDESHSFLAAGYSLLLQKYTRRPISTLGAHLRLRNATQTCCDDCHKQFTTRPCLLNVCVALNLHQKLLPK